PDRGDRAGPHRPGCRRGGLRRGVRPAAPGRPAPSPGHRPGGAPARGPGRGGPPARVRRRGGRGRRTAPAHPGRGLPAAHRSRRRGAARARGGRPMTLDTRSTDLRPLERSTAYWAVADAWTMVRRQLLYYVRQPTTILWQLGFPIVSVLLFVYVFGSAMNIGGGADYTSFAMQIGRAHV